MYLPRGITPAHAGKRYCLSVPANCHRDHPRPCGEKYPAHHHARRTTRITPAHAGKSAKLDKRNRLSRDHPRPCGEKRQSHDQSLISKGSPPPMRGKEVEIVNGNTIKGITPAHAGKSGFWGRPRLSHRDHPRPCGEKDWISVAQKAGQGSPPPMRGKVRAGRKRHEKCGITPAHAGKSQRQPRRVRGCADHPRPCGEKDSA